MSLSAILCIATRIQFNIVYFVLVPWLFCIPFWLPCVQTHEKQVRPIERPLGKIETGKCIRGRLPGSVVGQYVDVRFYGGVQHRIQKNGKLRWLLVLFMHGASDTVIQAHVCGDSYFRGPPAQQAPATLRKGLMGSAGDGFRTKFSISIM